MADHIAPLKSTLHTIANARTHGVSYVVEVDSGVSGPSAALLACTHGNEPVGLAAFQYLLSDLTLLRGKIYFVVANPKAAECYFNAGCSDAKEDSRYIDKNLNRLPELDELAGSQVYEFQRAAELLPILQQVDGVLDLHSTSSDAPPMLLCVDETSAELVRDAVFPFENVIADIHKHISGKFLIEYAEQAKVKILAECGQHECLEASQRAIDVSLAFLHCMGLVEDFQPSDRTKEIAYYQCKQAVFLPQNCDELRLRKVIEAFEFVKKGQVLACNGANIEAESPDSGYAVMCPETDNTLDCSEALLFLCDKLSV
ncbi:MAG: succinylglutamate desuccinylase/aspartoacylase family protein [Rickettsiales bacterium]|nr:succinylglutamate desuccinylase/aspartoacylase family protein [Rickettsiales bacterium]